MANLSVVIVARNEEKKIAECLSSVEGLADEIIVVDSESTDMTALIAKKFPVKLYSHKNDPIMVNNKNFGFSKATSKWIFLLDADERLTPELREEIKNTIAGESEAVGYWIARKNIIFGKWIKHSGWYPDYQLRLFRREKGRYPGEYVHEVLSIDGSVGYLSSPMIHYNYESIAQFLYKLVNTYTPNQAEVLAKKGVRVTSLDALRYPFDQFLSRYFSQEGYKDGLHGLVLSLLQAFDHFIIFCLLWEKQKFESRDDEDLLISVQKEAKKMNKELAYWTYTALLTKKASHMQQLATRVKRKIITQQLKK